MANKLSNEQFLEEVNRIDQESKQLQLELSDCLQINDDLTKHIELREVELVTKDERLIRTREKNSAELEQLAAEEISTREHCTHDINMHISTLSNLRIRKQRLLEMKLENERLRSSVNYLEESLEKNSRVHATSMHEMNKSMMQLRQQMELKLRKELIGLEYSFEQEAFDSLHDRQKAAMYENAKLKDEVAIQGVGIANLTSRLNKQIKNYQKCRRQLIHLNQKSNNLRERLAESTRIKNNIQRSKEQFRQDEALLLNQRIELISHLSVAKTLEKKTFKSTINSSKNSLLNSKTIQSNKLIKSFDPLESMGSASSTLKSPNMASFEGDSSTQIKESATSSSNHSMLDILSNEYLNSKKVLLHEKLQKILWKLRYERFKNVHLELKPTNPEEDQGHYSIKMFPIHDLVKEIVGYINFLKKNPSHPITIIVNQSQHEDNETLLVNVIQDLLEVDQGFNKAMTGLIGKESSFLIALQAESNFHKNQIEEYFNAPDQNMIAWVALKIMAIWCQTEVEVMSFFERSEKNQLSFLSQDSDTEEEMDASQLLNTIRSTTLDLSPSFTRNRGISSILSSDNNVESSTIENDGDEDAIVEEIVFKLDGEEENDEENDDDNNNNENESAGEFKGPEPKGSEINEPEEAGNLVSEAMQSIQENNEMIAKSKEFLLSDFPPEITTNGFIYQDQPENLLYQGELTEEELEKLWDDSFASSIENTKSSAEGVRRKTWLKRPPSHKIDAFANQLVETMLTIKTTIDYRDHRSLVSNALDIGPPMMFKSTPTPRLEFSEPTISSNSSTISNISQMSEPIKRTIVFDPLIQFARTHSKKTLKGPRIFPSSSSFSDDINQTNQNISLPTKKKQYSASASNLPRPSNKLLRALNHSRTVNQLHSTNPTKIP